jgi:ADP-dependent phosphofructokinase/glucokinase
MIKIKDNILIDATSNCYILKQKNTIQDENSANFGKITYLDLGYYTNIESCIKGFYRLEIRKYISKAEESSLKDLSEKIDELKKEIKELSDKIGE